MLEKFTPYWGNGDVHPKSTCFHTEVGNVLLIEHPKLYERFGGGSKKKIILIESVKKTATDLLIEGADLSNAFNRIALISDTQSVWTDSDDDQRMLSGFISDEFGMIDNDENSFGVNLIW